MTRNERRDQERMHHVNALGKESALRIACLCLPTVAHNVVLTLTVKGRLGKGAMLYGYDGECRFGTPKRITFVRADEYQGVCPNCWCIGRVLEGSKCAECGNPVDAVKVSADHIVFDTLRHEARQRVKR